MRKCTVLFYATILTSAFIIVACQKQQEVSNTKSTTQSQNSRTHFSINQPTPDCRISSEKAKLFVERFRKREEENGKKPEEYVVGYTIPTKGILDVIKQAEEQNIKIDYIYTYKGINDAGKETLIYGGMDETGKEILFWPNTTENWHQPVLEDVGGDITNTNATLLNILNDK